MIVARPQAGNAKAAAEPTRPPLAAIERVTLTVPARLHLGFVDLNGALGRRFGSLGIAIDAPHTRLSIGRAEQLRVSGADSSRARQHLERLASHFALDSGLHLQIDESIPSHVGLGSGTQLGLAVATAVSTLFGLGLNARAVAQLLDRGARSSIGIGAFEQGGVVLDGGKGEGDEPPPILSRMPFPEEWRVLLIFDRARQGLNGQHEANAFRRMPTFPGDRAAELCRLVLMLALPSLAERNLDGFGRAVTAMQRMIGDHFAPAQGARYMSPAVAEVLAWFDAEGVRGYGQSSWGPTGFGLIANEAEAQALLAQARRHWPADSGLAFALTRGRNRGAEIDVLPSRD